ncbi:hypothetical protein EYF80_041672 [Liparis tanakae]|uniref:Uncharacterized protein n=1 Tax=Liparis tanakae TaxID=230148 RepID=A0A4Z2G5V8_9TELE|nr:hypothetical protein EYF80_041672 [Liparis tanakae]
MAKSHPRSEAAKYRISGDGGLTTNQPAVVRLKLGGRCWTELTGETQPTGRKKLSIKVYG